MTEASDKDQLTGKQITAKLNAAKTQSVRHVRNKKTSGKCGSGSMNGHYGKLEMAACGLGGRCQSEKLFNIRNNITGVLISP